MLQEFRQLQHKRKEALSLKHNCFDSKILTTFQSLTCSTLALTHTVPRSRHCLILGVEWPEKLLGLSAMPFSVLTVLFPVISGLEGPFPPSHALLSEHQNALCCFCRGLPTRLHTHIARNPSKAAYAIIPKCLSTPNWMKKPWKPWVTRLNL